MSATSISCAGEVHLAGEQLVGLEHPVVELPERASRVGEHVVGEPVDRLDLGEPLAVVEVLQDRQRLGDHLGARAELEGAAHERLRCSSQQPVELRHHPAVGEPQDRAQRRHHRHLRDVERGAHDRQRGDRQVGPCGGREGGEDPAEAPADDVHRATAGVLADGPDRLGDHLVDPVLEAEPAVLERDLAVLHEVGRPALLHEVLDQGAAAAEVVAERRSGQRGDQQDRVAALLGLLLRAVVVDLAQGSVVDERPRHRAEVRQTAVHHLVCDVAGGGRDLVRLRDQIHGRKLPTNAEPGHVVRGGSDAWT